MYINTPIPIKDVTLSAIDYVNLCEKVEKLEKKAFHFERLMKDLINKKVMIHGLEKLATYKDIKIGQDPHFFNYITITLLNENEIWDEIGD